MSWKITEPWIKKPKYESKWPCKIYFYLVFLVWVILQNNKRTKKTHTLEEFNYEKILTQYLNKLNHTHTHTKSECPLSSITTRFSCCYFCSNPWKIALTLLFGDRNFLVVLSLCSERSARFKFCKNFKFRDIAKRDTLTREMKKKRLWFHLLQIKQDFFILWYFSSKYSLFLFCAYDTHTHISRNKIENHRV